jgi:hypothetical protein
MGDAIPITEIDLKVKAILTEIIGRPITPRLMRDIASAVERATGKPCWCDRALNPVVLTHQGILRVAFMEADWRINTIQLNPGVAALQPAPPTTH